MTSQKTSPDVSTPSRPPTSWLQRMADLPRTVWAGLFRRQSAPPTEELSLPPMSRGLQRFSMIMFFLLGAALTAFVVGNPLGIPFLPNAGSGTAQAPEQPAESHETLYQCSMHAEVIESQPGVCPKCLMELVPIEPAGVEKSPGAEEPSDGKPPVPEGEREVLYWYAPWTRRTFVTSRGCPPWA